MIEPQADNRQDAPATGAPILVPAPSMSGLGIKVVVAVVLMNSVGLLWMAVRSYSDAATRNTLDGMAQFALGACVAFCAYRLLVRYPFRILDLLTIVTTLSVGTKVMIDALTVFSQQGLIFEGQTRNGEKFGPVLLTVLLACSVLLVGAALGLRYCVRLKLDRALPRIWAVMSGMLALPALTGGLVFALVFISALADKEAFFRGSASLNSAVRTRQSAELMQVSIFLWVGSLVFCFSNALLFIKSLTNESEVAQ